MTNEAETSQHYLQKKIMLLFLGVMTSFLLLFFVYESERELSIYSDYQNQIRIAGKSATSELISSINSSKRSIDYLSDLPIIEQFIEDFSNDKPDKSSFQKNQISKEITETFVALLKNSKELIQARIILSNGVEYIRVESNSSDVIVTPENLLQSKENRDYFQAGMTLSNEEVYISDISPNYEHGEISYPLVPTYRAIKQLRTPNNKVIALLVLNVDAKLILEKLNSSNPKLHPHLENFLINSNGFYLAAPSSEILFGKDLGKEGNNWFLHTNNQTPLATRESFQTDLFGSSYLFSSQSVGFSSGSKSAPYYLYTGVPKDIIAKDIKEQRQDFLISSVIFLCLNALIFIAFSQYLKRQKQYSLEQSQFKAIVTHSSDAILSIDATGTIENWNQAASLLFGLTKMETKEQNIFNLIQTDKTDLFSSQSLERILSSKDKFQIELEAKTQLNTLRSLQITLFPIKEANEQSNTIALIIRDITHEKENHNKLESMNTDLSKELKTVSEELELEKQKTLLASKSKSVFIAYISHEIRTPLNSIKGLLTLARAPERPEKQQDYLKMAQESTDTLNVLINDIMNFSKIESGKLDLNPAAFNLRPLLEQVLISTSFLIKQKDIEVIVDMSRMELECVILDEDRVKQILTNLLSNAIKYTSSGEVILTVSTHIKEDNPDMLEIEFQVDDTGIGIPEEQQANLFKPLMQAGENNANRFSGLGLGLFISKQLCEIMNGKLRLKSEAGKGSSFLANLNCKKSNINEAGMKNDINTEQRDKCVAILVKNTHLSRILRKQFHVWRMDSTSFQTSNELLEKIPSLKPGLILLDDVFLNAQLEQQLKDNNTKVIYLTPQGKNVHDSLTGFYLSKPLIPSQLASMINQKQHQTVSNVTPIKKQPNRNHVSSTHERHTETTHPSEQIIFVVDDNEINRIVGAGILKSLALTINTAVNGEDLIQQLKKLKPSSCIPVILMDCQMPILDGYECTKLIREGDAGEWLKNAPIIALTADAMSNNQIECQKAGMNDFISKPFEPDQLISLVLQWTKKIPENI